jgi:hypothetical protein
MRYIMDTNIWVDVRRGSVTCGELRRKTDIGIALAPPVIIELVRGVIKGGGQNFSQDQALFRCMAQPGTEILQLPRVFVTKVLWNIPGGTSGVVPQDYKQLIDSLIDSKSFTEFLAKTEKRGSQWQRMSEIHSIHEGVLEKELRSLEKLAEGASVKAIAVNLARLYKYGGLMPDPESFERNFSAAIEFLRSSILQVRNGAKPRKNDRGLYVDQQLFFYLANPALTVVTKENFSSEIKRSVQAARIINFEAFRKI